MSEYIKEGITLGGVTGTLKDLDTSDATATAEDILEGKVAYARGERIVGTMKEGPEPIEILDPNEVYYADIEGDGEVDGVIFADLAVGGSGFLGSLGAGNYNIPTETNLKQYYIKDENYSNDFGKGRENTATMIAEWNKGENGKYGQQNTGAYDDIWVANNSLGSITASVVYNSYFVRLATTF